MRPLFAAALIALAATAAAAEEEAPRAISGSLTYPERIALPASAEVMLELRDRPGLLLAQQRFPTDGRQVPLPFGIEGMAGVPMALRGAVFAEGRTLRVTDPVEIAAGSGPVELAPIRLREHQPMGFASLLQCGEALVELGYVDSIARLRVNGRVIDLVPDLAAPLPRFVAEGTPETSVTTTGRRAQIVLDGAELAECLPATAVPALPFSARGQDPDWSLRLEDGMLRFAVAGGPDLSAPLPPAAPLAEGEGVAYDLPGPGFGLAIEARLCRDAASGMPHPHAVTARLDGAVFEGCGGDPGALLRGVEWKVLSVAGEAVPPALGVKVAFAETEVSGLGPCNYLFGDFRADADGISLGPIAITRRICDDDRRELELRLIALLDDAVRFDLDAEGGLRLEAADGRAVEARQ